MTTSTITITTKQTLLKQRLINVLSIHPRIAMFGIGLAIAAATVKATGVFDNQFAFAVNGHCNHC